MFNNTKVEIKPHNNPWKRTRPNGEIVRYTHELFINGNVYTDGDLAKLEGLKEKMSNDYSFYQRIMKIHRDNLEYTPISEYHPIFSRI